MGQFRKEPRIHVTGRNDRVKLGGTDNEVAVLNPAAILEIKLLFSVKILHGRWFPDGGSDPVKAANIIRPMAPRRIAEYMRERKVGKWGIIQADSMVGQQQQVDAADSARHPIGSWPLYSREFAESWLKAGKGRN
jgi:hypothetical protein